MALTCFRENHVCDGLRKDGETLEEPKFFLWKMEDVKEETSWENINLYLVQEYTQGPF